MAGRKIRSGEASLAGHYFRYLHANMFIALAGFITFPFMTRELTRYEYGIFGYYETLILIVTAVFKYGYQESIQRFFPEICRDKPVAERSRF